MTPSAGAPATLVMRQDQHPATIIDAFHKGSAFYVVARLNAHGTRYVFRGRPGGKWVEVIENPATGRYRMLHGGVGLRLDQAETAPELSPNFGDGRTG